MQTIPKAWVGLFGGLLALGISIQEGQGGEKIEFSDPDVLIESPSKILRQDPKRAVEIQPSGPSHETLHAPVSAPDSKASSLSQSRLNQLLGKQKNWMMQAPGKIDQTAALKEIYGIRDYSLTTAEVAKTQGLPEWDGGRSTSAPRPTADEPLGVSSSELGQLGTSPAGAYLSTPRSALPSLSPGLGLEGAPSLPMTIDSLPHLMQDLNRSRLPGSFSTTANDSLRTRNRQRNQSDDWSTQFERSLEPRNLFLRQLQDPLGLNADATRQVLNPVTAGTPRESFGVSASALAPPSGPGAILGSAVPTLDMFQGSRSGGSSLTPSVSAPPPSRNVIRPAPPVLPIPKRKF